MNKQTKIVIGVIAVIVVALGIFLLLNKDSMDEKQKAKEDEVFYITAGEEKYPVNMDVLNEIGLSEMKADYKKSGKAPVEKTYEGVPFATILEKENISTDGANSVVFTASDGYTSAIGLEEALDKESCFIAIKVEGKPIDNGPYMMLLSKDQFSQRWCSYLLDVVIE